MVHAPPWQASPTVHASPSWHRVPSGAAPWVQPVPGAQPSTVHVFASSQAAGRPAVQTPPAHVSAPVQALPSSQLPSPGAWMHPVAGAQLSTVQGWPSSQSSAPNATHAPPLQFSWVVQASPSAHGRLLATCAQTPEEQVSMVHGLPSLQLTATPPPQEPSLQVSSTVHASASSQGVVFAARSRAQAPFGWHTAMVQTIPGGGQSVAVTQVGIEVSARGPSRPDVSNCASSATSSTALSVRSRPPGASRLPPSPGPRSETASPLPLSGNSWSVPPCPASVRVPRPPPWSVQPHKITNAHTAIAGAGTGRARSFIGPRIHPRSWFLSGMVPTAADRPSVCRLLSHRQALPKGRAQLQRGSGDLSYALAGLWSSPAPAAIRDPGSVGCQRRTADVHWATGPPQ